jgi:hypothetical protein
MGISYSCFKNGILELIQRRFHLHNSYFAYFKGKKGEFEAEAATVHL